MSRGVSARRPHARARAAIGRPGDAHALDDPRRLAARLLAARGRDPRRAARLVAPVRKPRPTSASSSDRPTRRALMADGPRRHEELVEVVGRRLGDGRAVARARPRPAVGNLGEAARAPLPDRRALGRTGGRRRTTALDHLVRRYLGAFGPASRDDIAQWAGMSSATSRRRSSACGSGASATSRRRAPRPPSRSAPRSGDAGARALPADVGRGAARPRAPDRRAARGVPAADLRDEDAAVDRHVPRRRRRRRHVEARRRPHRVGGVRAASISATAREVGEEAEQLAAFHA